MVLEQVRTVFLLIAMSCAMACGEEPPAPPPAQEEAAEQEPTVTAVTVGYQETPAAPSAGQRRAHKAATKQLGRGDSTAARASWERLVQDNPGFEMARYHIAQAMAKAGQFSEARQALEALFQRDLPRYRRRYENDDEMASLRASSEGTLLTEAIANLESQYRQAVAQGVPMMMTRPGHGKPVRGGVWVQSAERFVPLGQEMRNSHAALIDTELGKSISMTVGRGAGTVAVRMYVHPLYGEQGSFGDVQLRDVAYVEIEPSADGARFRFLHGESFDGAFGSLREANTQWLDIPGDYNRRSLERWAQGQTETGLSANQGPTRSWSLSSGHLVPPNTTSRMWPWRARSGGWRFMGNRIENEEGRRIELSRGHGARNMHFTLASPDGSSLLAWSNKWLSPCSHIIDHVDLESGTVTEVHSGRGVGNVRFGPDGALYVQVGEETRRLEPNQRNYAEGQAISRGVNVGTTDCRVAGARYLWPAAG